jgi:TonB family protein
MPTINVRKLMIRHALWVSLLLHLLLYVSFTTMIVIPSTKTREKPSLYIPSYTYQPQSTLPTPVSHTQKMIPTDKQGTEKQLASISTADEMNAAPQPTMQRVARKASKKSQFVHLVGDRKTDKPLVKILGTAISEHLVYPKIAVDFHLKGTAYVGFTLHPDGQVTGVKLEQSSGAEVLDNAAVSGISAITPVRNVGPYVPVAEYLVVGIIFS